MNMIQTKGKRKTSIARAVFKPGKGRIRINKAPLELYQPDLSRMQIEEILSFCDSDIYLISILFPRRLKSVFSTILTSSLPTTSLGS